MKVYVVFEDLWYEGGDILSVHSREWFADYRAYMEAKALSRDYDDNCPEWNGHDWLSVAGYKNVWVHAMGVTP